MDDAALTMDEPGPTGHDPAAATGAPALDLCAIEDEPLAAWRFKCLPPRADGVALRALGALGLSLPAQDLPLPAALLNRSALEHNARSMREFARRAGVELCPHGKTTMAPQLFARQLADGAWGITAATAAHVRTYRRFGVPRVLLANQLVGRANVAMVLDELRADPAFDFYCLVDSAASLQVLQAALAQQPIGRPLQVLLEVGATGGRTGVRSVEEGVALGRVIAAAAPAIALRGVEAFEDVFGRNEHSRVELAVLGVMDRVARLARTGCDEDWFAPGDVILSAGGSSFFDIVARTLGEVRGARAFRPVLRSGCYLTHDSVHYARIQERMRERGDRHWSAMPGLRAAIEVWGAVQSAPEPGRIILSLGKRDVSYDLDLPVPLAWLRPGEHARPQPAPAGLRLVALNDQHAWVDGESPLRVGDLVGVGVSHPCTTFDKWPLLLEVDDDYRVIGGIRTFF
jgi:D-serine dehydratase